MDCKFKEYKILSDSRLEKNIKSNLPEEYREVFNNKMKYFANNPYHPSLNTKKYNVSPKTLSRLDVSEVWEFYINRKEHRCIFYVSHIREEVIIAYVGNHKQLKKKFK